jgi:GDP-4-dehydro-6-deoxy-D-mannose reductase
MSKTILITGASGYTGMHACSYFTKKNFRVIGVVRKKAAALQCEQVICDLSDKTQVFHMIKKLCPDYCLHLAGINSVASSWCEPLAAIENNAMNTLHLLESLRQIKRNCRTLITGSALSGDNHPYAVSKFFQQKLSLDWARFFQLPVIVVKPCNLIGPGRSSGFLSVLAKQIAYMDENNQAEIIKVSHIGNKREYLDVRDAVSAYHLLLTSGLTQSIYEVGSGEMNSLLDVKKIFETITGMKLNFVSTESSADEPPKLMDSSEVKKLNWSPNYSIEESIFQTLSYFKAKI